MEHVFKRMRHASEIRLHYASALTETRAAEMLERLLRQTEQQTSVLVWSGFCHHSRCDFAVANSDSASGAEHFFLLSRASYHQPFSGVARCPTWSETESQVFLPSSRDL